MAQIDQQIRQAEDVLKRLTREASTFDEVG